VNETFGKDVYPAVATGWVGGWSREDVNTVGGVGESAGCEGIRDVRRFGT
jgi:hypothetical protein